MDEQSKLYQTNEDKNRKYHEETAAEITSPYTVRDKNVNQEEKMGVNSKVYGYAALILAILSFFFAQFVLGVVAVILGFIALRKGDVTLGSWSIGIAAFSLIIGVLIRPFF